MSSNSPLMIAQSMEKRALQLYIKNNHNLNTNESKYNPQKIIKLKGWPDNVRAIPNCFVRSALFSALAKRERAFINNECIPTPKGFTIKYTGYELDQGDLDVFAAILHTNRYSGLGSEIKITTYKLLQLIGLTDGGRNREILERRIDRLVNTELTIKQGNKILYHGKIINSAIKNKNKEWIIFLSSNLYTLLSGDKFTLSDHIITNDLRGKQLAQWLYRYYSTHAQPFPIKISTIHKFCGSKALVITDFKKTLCNALYQVGCIYNNYGLKFEYEIKGSLLHVKKEGTKSQKRHVKKKNKNSDLPF